MNKRHCGVRIEARAAINADGSVETHVFEGDEIVAIERFGKVAIIAPSRPLTVGGSQVRLLTNESLDKFQG